MKGTAIGTKMAPTYATLTLGDLEEILLDKVQQNREINSETLSQRTGNVFKTIVYHLGLR